MTRPGNGSTLRVLYGIAVYAAIAAFCLSIWALFVWLYLDHPVWFAFTLAATIIVFVAAMWDDIWVDTPEPEPERPRLRRVV